MRSSGMAVKEQRTEYLVGLFLLIGLGLLGWLILSFGELEDGGRATYRVEVRFSDATSVIEGTKVKLAGATIGEVSETPFLEPPSGPQGVLVDAKVRVPIDIEERWRLPADAIFQIQSATVLGDKVIVVTIPEEASPERLVEGATLNGGGASGLEAIQSDAVAVAEDARQVMEDARLSMIKLETTLDDIQAVARGLTETVETVNAEILSERNLASVGRTIANIEDASVGVKSLAADIKPLLVDTQRAIQQIETVGIRAETTFAKVNQSLEEVGPAMEAVPETMESIQRVADSAEGAFGEAEKTLASLNDSGGLVETLTKDEEVSTDTKAFVKNLRRYGVLGYRDEDTPEDDPRERFRGRRR
ncbi:MAG: MlaD family protein [Verrucomicrobiota bacterium]